jgi:hypothetical protein
MLAQTLQRCQVVGSIPVHDSYDRGLRAEQGFIAVYACHDAQSLEVAAAFCAEARRVGGKEVQAERERDGIVAR